MKTLINVLYILGVLVFFNVKNLSAQQLNENIRVGFNLSRNEKTSHISDLNNWKDIFILEEQTNNLRGGHAKFFENALDSTFRHGKHPAKISSSVTKLTKWSRSLVDSTMESALQIRVDPYHCSEYLDSSDIDLVGVQTTSRVIYELNGVIVSQFPFVLQPGENQLCVTVIDDKEITQQVEATLFYDFDCCRGTKTSCNGRIIELTFVNPSLTDLCRALCYNGNTLTAPPGVIIGINGTLTANIDLTISGLTFNFGEEASFLIGSQRVVLEGCVLTHCRKMWKGILHQNTAGYLNVNNSRIEGAYTGITIQKDAPFNIHATDFVNNVVGIEIESFTQSVNRTITGCKFYKAGYGLPEPYYASYPLSGIVVRNSKNLSIGDYQGNDVNEFYELLNGIVCINSGVVIKANYFKGISASLYHNSNKPFYKQAYGTAVFAASNWFLKENLKIEVKTSHTHVGVLHNFEDCDRAVYVASQNAEIYYNNIYNCIAGVRADYNLMDTIEIVENFIDKTKQGIYTYWNLGGRFMIQENEVHAQEIDPSLYMNDLPGVYKVQPFAIKSEAAWLTMGDKPLEIAHNDVYGGRNSIWLSHVCGHACVNDNRVEVKPTNRIIFGNFPAVQNTAAAIYVNDSRQPEIAKNYVFGNSHLHNQGIHMQRTFEHLTHCNQLTDFGVGMYFRENCLTDELSIRENRTEFNQINWMLDRVGSTPGTIGNSIGDFCVDNNNLFPANPIGIHTYNFDLGIGPNNAPNIYNANRVFNPIINRSYSGIRNFTSNQSNCLNRVWISNNCNLSGPEHMDGSISRIDKILHDINDTVSYPFLKNGTDWMNRLKAFAELQEDTSLLALEPQLQNFYALNQASEIGQLNQVQKQLLEAGDSSMLIDSLAYIGFLEALQQNIHEIEDETLFATNEKWAMTIEEKVLSGGHDSLYTEEVEALRTLAESCPYLEGPGVYRARKILAYFEPGTFYDDKEICSNLGSNRYGEDVKVADEYAYERESVPVIAEAKVRLLENPVSRELNLLFSPGYSEEVSLMVCDIQGRVLLQTHAKQQGFHSLLLPTLVSGTYFLRINSLEEGSVCLKFIKQ